MAETKKEKDNQGKIGSFFRSVKKEFKKITWPKRERVINETIAVVCISVVLGAIIAAMDFVFYSGLGLIIK